MGQRDYVGDQPVRAGIARFPRCESVVGACHTGRYRRLVLSMAFTSNFTWRVTPLSLSIEVELGAAHWIERHDKAPLSGH